MNQQILSQDEVDALLQGITGESQKMEEDDAPAAGVRNYDLASQERIVRGRMPTMEVINERFARNIRLGLFNLIRKSPEVSIGGIKVQKFSAFLREIVVPTNFNIVAVKPLRGSGLIICDPSLVFAVIDSLFGGIGKFHTRIEGRDFSPTELRVILRLVEVITSEFKKAWTGIYPLELEYQRSEMQPSLRTSRRPVKSWCPQRSSWRLATSLAPSISACLMPSWSRFGMCCIRLRRVIRSRWIVAGCAS